MYESKHPRSTRRLIRWALPVFGVLAIGFGTFALIGGLDRDVRVEVGGPGAEPVEVALVDAAVGFDVTPDTIVVEAGTKLRLQVVNEGDEPHDLEAEGGARTRILEPGESQLLDLGTVHESGSALCTISGHALAGMTLQIDVA